MPTLFAEIKATPAEIADSLARSGLSWRNPTSGDISIWTDIGDRLVVASPKQAIEMLSNGSCLQLWFSDGHDIAIGNTDGKARLFMDGLSAQRVAALVDDLRRHGFVCNVAAQ